MNNLEIIGRKNELEILNKTLKTSEAELVAITGRRRIGKTFLISTLFKSNIVFELIGTQNAPMNEQLQNFADQLGAFAKSSLPEKRPKSWNEAFHILRTYLEGLPNLEQSKKVIFFDELPWLAGQKSNFLQSFAYFWNSWASRKNLVVVICGSAASWMVQKVVNDRGGLHNRITKHIHLEPFTLSETKLYLESRKVFYEPYQITQIYMALGGVPFYLKQLDPTKSAVQNIDSLCFSKNGLLTDEFNRLYPALFAHAENHIVAIRTLAKKKLGMTREELASNGKLENGGGLTKILNELILSGFITETFPFGKKKKEKLYRLTDEYSLFYLQFIEKLNPKTGEIWTQLSQTAEYKTWAGYAFESICLKHVSQIKKALGISGIFTKSSSFFQKEPEGVQIDIVLDRADFIINLFEVKYYNSPYIITKEYAEKLRKRMWRFQALTNSKKQINWVFISTFGLSQNEYSLSLINNTLTLEDLFTD